MLVIIYSNEWEGKTWFGLISLWYQSLRFSYNPSCHRDTYCDTFFFFFMYHLLLNLVFCTVHHHKLHLSHKIKTYSQTLLVINLDITMVVIDETNKSNTPSHTTLIQPPLLPISKTMFLSPWASTPVTILHGSSCLRYSA